MEFTLTIAIFIFLGAVICELIDAALGMLYGTILSPVLIIAGFNPILVVPAILFSGASVSTYRRRPGRMNCCRII